MTLFSSISRYRKLPEVVATGPDGRAHASTTLRLLPPAAGRFHHTVEEGDRLDHLAHKYYDQSRDWWRILDANPAFVAPDALLGDDQMETVHLPLAWVGPLPPWSDLLRDLRATPGIETALLGSIDQPHPVVDVVAGPALFQIPATLSAALDQSVRTQALVVELSTALAAGGLDPGDDLRVGRIDGATWRITDRDAHSIHTIRHHPADSALTVYATPARAEWLLVATFDGLLRSAPQLLALAEARGFEVGTPARVRRIGKPVVIPPRRA